MKLGIATEQLVKLGLDHQTAQHLLPQIDALLQNAHEPEEAWQLLAKEILSSTIPFSIHLLFFSTLFPHWRTDPETAPAWMPSKEGVISANIFKFMSKLNLSHVKTFHSWTINHFQEFWQQMVSQLNIVFKKMPGEIVDLTKGVESPNWFPNAVMNIADSCFTADPSAPAIIFEDEKKSLFTLSYEALNRFTNRVANSLLQQGFAAGDAIGIAMPMNQYAIAIYLGIIKMGGIVVSIADSFSTEEIATRLRIANAKAIFTQDFTSWSGKKLPLYEKVKNIQTFSTQLTPLAIIVVPCENKVDLPLRNEDSAWHDFLIENDMFISVSRDPMDPCNILFSSGTTGDPKAIVWNHTTPIKAASDAFFHQNIQAGDVLAWPTNLGWMMGPWLIFAALINHGRIALYLEAPKDRGFGEFIQRAKVNMLGVVPTLVTSWRQSKCMENIDWSTIKVFSSTGECSNPEDMLYLMSLAGYKPVIEYCGGTEIGGAYLTSTVIENNYPSLFTTPTMGLNIAILNEEGKPATIGEVAIIPPSIGLSTTLLNANHYHVYYQSMPKSTEGKTLRRHGDQIKLFPGGHYCILGRVDDTMKLGGIKISAAEIERTLSGIPQITEVAAISIPPHDQGPSLLVVYASTKENLDKQSIIKEMQNKINTRLNPLFKIHDVVFTSELPKTASNKIIRRVLRKKYQEEKKRQ